MSHLISKRRKREILEQNPEVISVGDGTSNGQEVVVIRVDEITAGLRDRLPNTVEGHPVVIKESDRLSTDGIGDILAPFGARSGFSMSQVHGSKVRPVPPGVSTGPDAEDTYSGTTSFIMTDGSTDYITSNNHVFAGSNGFSTGQQFTQPSPNDGGVTPEDIIGGLSDYIPMEDGVTVDLAWLEPTVDVTTRIRGIGKVSGQIHSPSPDDPIMESGRTSGVSTGIIEEVNATVTIDYPDPAGEVTLEEIVMSTKMGTGGDSGSPVVLNTGSEPYDPVAIHFAGGSDVTAHCSMENVVQESGLEIVPSDVSGASFAVESVTSTTNENVATVEYTVSNNGSEQGSGTVTIGADVGMNGTDDQTKSVDHTLAAGDSVTNTVEFTFQVTEVRDVSFCASV